MLLNSFYQLMVCTEVMINEIIFLAILENASSSHECSVLKGVQRCLWRQRVTLRGIHSTSNPPSCWDEKSTDLQNVKISRSDQLKSASICDVIILMDCQVSRMCVNIWLNWTDRGVNDSHIWCTRFLVFQRDFCRRCTRFMISYRDIQRFLTNDLQYPSEPIFLKLRWSLTKSLNISIVSPTNF